MKHKARDRCARCGVPLAGAPVAAWTPRGARRAFCVKCAKTLRRKYREERQLGLFAGEAYPGGRDGR